MTDTKRCLRKSKHGCGQLLSLEKFSKRERPRKDGTFRLEVEPRCKECQANFISRGKAMKRRDSALNKYEEFKISEAGEYFFCRVPPVPMAVELREARRG